MHAYGIPGPGGEMQQQPQTPVQQNHGGSSPSSGGQRMSPVTSSVGQSAHGESITTAIRGRVSLGAVGAPAPTVSWENLFIVLYYS